MSATSKKKPTKEKLADYAEAVRKELEFRGQDETYKVAVQIGYLAAQADGTVEDAEKQAIVDSVQVLSKGLVIEWEVDAIIEEAQADESEADARAEALGAKLAELGQADLGLLFGAFVAQASSGIDKQERAALRKVGRAAGIKDHRIRAILKVVGGEQPE